MKTNENYLMLYPKKVDKEIQRYIASLDFLEKDISDEKLEDLENLYQNLENEIESIDNSLEEIKQDHALKNILYTLNFEREKQKYLDYMAKSEHYFYLSLKNNQSLDTNYLREKFDKALIDDKNNLNKEISGVKKNNLGSEDYFLVFPTKTQNEVDRIIGSLGFVEKDIDKNISLNDLEEDYNNINEELESIEKSLDKLKSENLDILDNVRYTKYIDSKSDILKEKMAKSEHYFYLSGWVPESSVKKVNDIKKKYSDTLLKKKDEKNTSSIAPTKLKNNKIFKPFEALVNMYGTPSYNEIDPTSFFAITYILLYGMMFGDLGQGIIFLLIGLFLKNKNKLFSDMILRIGFSASVFGLLYGSFFGNETLIPTLLIKPFDNILTVLIASVSFGFILMFISYLMGIYNKLIKQKDIEEAIFGKEGLAGLIMMVSFVILILSITKILSVSVLVPIITLVISIIMEIFKKPLSIKLTRDNEKMENKADYYVESSFSIVEALLSVFSNLVSFTRVGAFAINHVGLFLAFKTMASLVGGIGSIIILILGNALIIGLEGMVVFIQGLRLEYYELFSKYYKGDGRLYKPIKSIED